MITPVGYSWRSGILELATTGVIGTDKASLTASETASWNFWISLDLAEGTVIWVLGHIGAPGFIGTVIWLLGHIGTPELKGLGTIGACDIGTCGIGTCGIGTCGIGTCGIGTPGPKGIVFW